MQNKPFRLGPLALANAVANILNPPTAAGGVNGGASGQYILLTHLRAVNKTGAAATLSLFIGATGVGAAGTEFAFSAASVAANSFLDWYGRVRLDTADFLTGFASAAATITLEGEGEIGVSG